MLLGFVYLHVCYIFFLRKAEYNRLKKTVGQTFVMLIVMFLFEVASVRSVDQQVNSVVR